MLLIFIIRIKFFRENIFKDFQKDYEEILNYLEFELNSTANKYNKDQTELII